MSKIERLDHDVFPAHAGLNQSRFIHATYDSVFPAHAGLNR